MKGILVSTLFALAIGSIYGVPVCPPGSNNALLPNPADCTSYYECLNGVPILLPCPPSLEWSDSLKRCEYPEVAQCEETENPPSSSSSTTGPSTTQGPSTTRGPVPDSCPEEDGPDDVLLPNPEDCGSFFKCLNGIPHLIQCPSGQEWSIELNRCDLPEIAQCSVSGPSSTSSGTSSTSTSRPIEVPTECPEEDGPDDVLLPNPADCGSFFKCLNGIPHLISCPPGQEWSIELNRCDLPEIAQCSVSRSSSTSSGTSSSSTPRPIEVPTECPEEDGPDDVLLPNPADCGSFFKCLNGIPHLISCPPGQEWSIELNRCDLPEIAQCSVSGSSSTSSGTSSSSTPRPIEVPTECPEEDGPDDVLLPNPADCGSFFKCLNGIPHLIPCPQGQQWSIELNRCDLPQIAKCVDDYTYDDVSGEVNENGCPVVDGPDDVLLPNPADCGSFYKCLAGTPILHKCPPGLQWNDATKYCDYAENAQCVETESSVGTQPSRPSTPSSSPIPPGDLPDHCPDEDGPTDVLLPNPDDCGSFFKCLGGLPHLVACPPNLHWSQSLQRCEYPDIAQCEERSRFVLRVERSEENECPLHNDGYDIFFPNPEDCSTYFQCSNGEKILKECPVGTLWDVGYQRCDHAANAVCAE